MGVNRKRRTWWKVRHVELGVQRAAPDQPVKPRRVPIEMARDRLGRACEVRGPDRLMGLLRIARPRPERPRPGRHAVRPEAIGDDRARLGDGRLRHRRRIGARVPTHDHEPRRHSAPSYSLRRYACFTRSEFKAERVSSDLITPSAARGILEAVHWKPAIRWVIDRLHAQHRVSYRSVYRTPHCVKTAVFSYVPYS